MKTKRRTHNSAFKARVAIEALKGIKTIQTDGQISGLIFRSHTNPCGTKH